MACSDKNSLVREGTAQYNRFLKALSPTFAQVDERNLRELLLFVQRYAAHVSYFDTENNSAGTWEPLIQRDISVVLASLTNLAPLTFADYHKSLVKRIRLAVREAGIDEAKRCFKYLFDLVYTLAKTVDQQCALLEDDMDYQQVIRDTIALKIDKGIRALLTFCTANHSLLPASSTTDPLAPFIPLNSSVTAYGFHYISDDPEPLNISVPDTDDLSKINFIVHHNLFQRQVKAVLTGTALAIQKADALFAESMSNYKKHRPHIALLQTFLRLFGHAQDQLNRYGKNHLEYYYKDILQLRPRRPEPDRAHLVFDLHAQLSDHLLKAGTSFKGGKDSDGKPLTYQLSQDVILNQAKVASVHSMNKVNGTLYASENSNQVPMFLFGESQNPSKAIGFAIASKLLFLKSGERTITVSIHLNETRLSVKWSRFRNLTFHTRLTGEKGWLEDQVRAIYHPQSGELVFSITIDGGKDAVQQYDEKIHQKNMQVSMPLLMVYIDQEASGMSYDLLAEKAIDRVRISVNVQGYKEAILSNDIGLLDGSKPFKPFGDLPRRGSGFYIGSDELFQKPLTSLSLITDLPAEFSAAYLYRGKWTALSLERTNGGYTLGIPKQPIQERSLAILTRAYGTGDRDGHIRLALTTDRYSLSAFMDSLTQSFNETKLMKIPIQTAVEGLFRSDLITGEATKKVEAKKMEVGVAASLEDNHKELLKTVVSATQFEGFRLVRNSTPTPKELVAGTFEINYSATDTLTFGNETKPGFFHLYPFGYKQIQQSKRLGLLPAVSNNGELFIGLAGVQAPKTISLLFEVVEGSSNPLKPAEAVHWYYLDGNNDWKKLEKEALIDGTKGLTRTGIVEVSLPSDATKQGTVMPQGMLWMMAAVEEQIDAVCKLASIRAQAGQVELIQDEANMLYFKTTLPKGTISKAVVSDAAIKRIEQPMDSFGGRPVELADRFYTRVSERLRHKQRAITMWDYERLVLEQFPAIYKVKCINRAGFVEANGTTVFCENYPGHVTVVTIPDLSKSAKSNPLRPYTPIGTLVDITDYLKDVNNPFVTLHVRNPQFEEIQLEFAVIFRPQLDETYHLKLLNDDIERFLCPWAFDTSTPVAFGGKIQKSTLIDFIDGLPYVHVVSTFKMHLIVRDEKQTIQTATYDVEEAVATSSRSILVSYADGTTRHLIHVIPNCECV
ncbi:hypothetical protein [Parapedobacter pyrenivorans]|uniref:hypothetical protein n=1 Tax=Parapedobacter pyrenivorans TaxID=1305674 RepID=UPI00333FBBA5